MKQIVHSLFRLSWVYQFTAISMANQDPAPLWLTSCSATIILFSMFKLGTQTVPNNYHRDWVIQFLADCNTLSIEKNTIESWLPRTLKRLGSKTQKQVLQSTKIKLQLYLDWAGSALNGTEITPMPNAEHKNSPEIRKIRNGDKGALEFRVVLLPTNIHTKEFFKCSLLFMIVSVHTKSGWKYIAFS